MTETQLEWPADLGYATIVGRFGFMDADGPDEDREPDITPATSGTVLITPSVDTVKYDGDLGPMLLIKRRVEGVIDADGYLATKNADGTPGPRGIVVPATDADVQPTGFTYSVRISLASSGTVASYSIEAPTGAVVDLAKATPVASSGGTVTVVDYTSAERAETAAITAVQAKNDAESARDDAEQARDDATTAAGIADTRATDASTSASTAADILAQTQALGITVDTSVGTRVFVGDTMIYGDTGWRDMRDQLLNGWAATEFMVRRINSIVYVQASALSNQAATDTRALDMPPGFRTGHSSNTVVGLLQFSSIFSSTVIWGIRGGSGGQWLQIEIGNDSPSIGGQLNFNTPNTWPTSLPGTPA